MCRVGWEMVIVEPQQSHIKSSCSSHFFWDPSPPGRPAEFSVLESPQVVLLCAGAFRQADVVHGHLAAPAPPALPLQDDLVNSRKWKQTNFIAKHLFWCEDRILTRQKITTHHVWPWWTYALQTGAPECDLSVPPAISTGPAPHCRTVLLPLLHKHLQHAHVVACQVVAERQAQIAVIPGWRERKDQPRPPPGALVANLRNSEVSSSCWRGTQTEYFIAHSL